jgi:acetolactate synthase I/II/III large subunit
MSVRSSSRSSATGGDAVVRALEAAGVEIVFGVASVHNLPLFDAVVRSSVRLVPTRTEAGAVNMADAYARVSGGIGVAITSTGTGAGNAGGALIEALAASSRVLHLTGQIESSYLGRGCGYIHETKDQLGFLTATSKTALRAERGKTGEAVIEAMRAMLEHPQGPVSIEIPIDYQYADSDLVEDAVGAPRRPLPAGEPMTAAAEALRAAKRPVIWAGGGVNASGAGAELQSLVEASGAALFTSNKGRGAVSEEHPQCVGNFGSHPLGREFLSRCDVLLSVGTHFRSNETETYRLSLPEQHVQIDVDAAAIGRTFPGSIGIVGDARLALQGIVERLAGPAPSRGYLQEIESLRDEVRSAVRSTLGPYQALADALAKHVRAPVVLARDVTVLGNVIANRLQPIQTAAENVYAVGGGIGQGLAMGLGAALARPEAGALLLAGDGGFACNLGELATAVQESARISVLVFDDGGYGVLRNVQDAEFGGRRVGVDLGGPDFVALARAFGWDATVVREPDAFDPAIAAGLRADRPTLAVADMAGIGEMRTKFLPPVNTPRKA